nr:hypothetical protein [Tanacetum cinerariifolium]
MAPGSKDRPPMLAPGRYPKWPTDNSPAVPEHTTFETPSNMSPENKAHFLAEKEAIHLILTGIRDDIYSTVDACQTAQEISQTTTKHKGKEIAKPITPLSKTASKEDNDPKQSQRDKDMQKNLALIVKYFKKIYKPTNNNLRTSSNSKNKNVDTTLRFKNDIQSGQFGNQRMVNVARARENVGSKVVQQSGIQCFNCREFGHFAKECSKQKRIKDSAYHKEKMLLCKHAEQESIKDVDSNDERVALANLIANLKLNVDENKKIQNQLEKANTTLAQELKECKTILAETSKSLGESISVRDNYMVALQTKQAELEKYKAFNDRIVDYDKLEVNQKPNVSRPQLKSNQSRDKVLPNNSQVNVKKTQVEVHPRIPSVSNKIKFVTACKDSFNSRNLNAIAVCATCNKCLVDSNHFACVTKMLNDVHARTKKPTVVPISTRKPKSQATKSIATPYKKKIVQLILFIVDSGCTKHMTGNLKLLCNFVEKFLGTVHFGNDQCAPILGYGDLVQGDVTINRVYYVEGLNHNLFSVGQFCDADLEVAFRKSICFVRDFQGNDLLTSNRGSNLYTISLQESTSSTPLCLIAKATPTQAWDQLCSSCELSKAKRSSFKSKTVPSSKGRLNLLHMDLCGPMRVACINGKKYVLVIVDDYSKYTWTLFLRSKDETPEVLKDFLTMIQRNFQASVITVHTYRGEKFLNKILNAFFKEEGIEHQTSTAQTPEQNDVVKRQNLEMSRDMLTVGSTMRIPLLYRGEYSQWVERFMNDLKEQMDGEAMINSIKNGDQPLPRVTQVSIAGTTSTEQPPLKDKSMWSDQEKRIQKIDRLARSLLIQGLSNDIYSLIDSNKTAKDL